LTVQKIPFESYGGFLRDLCSQPTLSRWENGVRVKKKSDRKRKQSKLPKKPNRRVARSGRTFLSH